MRAAAGTVSAVSSTLRALMKILLDFLPLVFFFVAYKMHGIYAGTAVLMAATALQMLVVYWMDKKLSAMHKATLAMVLVFGALTLALQDERFIKWKPSVLYVSMALAMAVALWGMGRNVLQMLLGSQMALPESIWHKLCVSWIVYCLCMAALNGYVVLFFSTDAWANFKLWGFVFPLAFIVGQGFYVASHLQTDAEDTPV